MTAESLFFVGKRRGRPTRAEAPSTKRVWCFVTASEREALEFVAKENGQALASVIRDAVNTYVADYCDRTIFVPRVRE